MPADLTQDILNSDVITLLTRAIPNPELQVEETANDSDKTITVASGEIWEILWIYVELTTTATVGNRVLHIEIRDDSNDIIFQTRAKNVQGASGTELYYIFPLGIEPSETIGGYHYIPIPPKCYLPSGYDIHILDNEAADAAADDMIVQMMVNRYDV